MEEGRKRFPRYSSFRDKSKFSASPSLPAAVAVLRYQHSQPDTSSSDPTQRDWRKFEDIF